ncbi:family 43 glycosylhydrolase [Planctomycetota bacterium]
MHSDAVPQPLAVRYAWAANPVGANLTNASGLPASLFKTDAWLAAFRHPLVPALSGPYVHVYKPGGDIYPGPDSERLRAGQRYEDWVPNDHAILKGQDGRWHALGITHPAVDGPPWHEGENLSFHAVSPPGLLQEVLNPQGWRDLPKVLPPRDRPGEKLQHHAPSIVRKDGLYYMIYGPNPIRYAVSEDLANWTPKGPLFVQEHGGRDPSLFHNDDHYIILLTSQKSVVARTSKDLLTWSEATTIYTLPPGETGGPESASLVRLGDTFYLFWCRWDAKIDDPYQYRTMVFASDDPMNFKKRDPVVELKGHAPEIFADERGNWYMSSVEWPHRGVSIAPLVWQPAAVEESRK